MPSAPVLRRREVIDHPQILANQTLAESDHPAAGRLRQVRPAARFSETPADHRRGAPLLGEHSRELLAELGVSDHEIADLAAASVVALGDDP